MEPNRISAAAFADTKQHYAILDGLRGVAALTVVCFHLFEAFATSHLDQRINHGYLAVDFFFILSGFVVGYAYDDRWGRMGVGEFLKRRFIRLHPMVVFGALIGAAVFYTQGCPVWDVSKITLGALAVATLMNALLLPAPISMEVRGVGEMYPLNGPSWSLLFEYIGNILYAFVLRLLPTRALGALVAVAGCSLAAFAMWGPLGDVCVGFSMTGDNIVGGMLRLLYAFPMGLLLSRLFRRYDELGLKGRVFIRADVALDPRKQDQNGMLLHFVIYLLPSHFIIHGCFLSLLTAVFFSSSIPVSPPAGSNSPVLFS